MQNLTNHQKQIIKNMRRTLFTLVVGLCFLATAQAQNYAKKLKKATGITVTYRSVYKGKPRPGGVMMSVCGDQVKLQNLSPEGKIVEPKANTLRQDTYIDYSRRLSYRRAVMPNNEVVYTNAPFEYGEGFTDVKTRSISDSTARWCARWSTQIPSTYGTPTT